MLASFVELRSILSDTFLCTKEFMGCVPTKMARDQSCPRNSYFPPDYSPNYKSAKIRFGKRTQDKAKRSTRDPEMTEAGQGQHHASTFTRPEENAQSLEESAAVAGGVHLQSSLA
ncbi:hypothetical protein BR93DRAFT_480981 [Coniochaeta sp. PMI_546]|nr:hypothetical protein BR93DRAFT_480981 [Coniochaeta sp. PMI_546]